MNRPFSLFIYIAYSYFWHVYLFIKLLYMNKSIINTPQLVVTNDLKLISSLKINHVKTKLSCRHICSSPCLYPIMSALGETQPKRSRKAVTVLNSAWSSGWFWSVLGYFSLNNSPTPTTYLMRQVSVVTPIPRPASLTSSLGDARARLLTAMCSSVPMPVLMARGARDRVGQRRACWSGTQRTAAIIYLQTACLYS